ncbi:glycosyltransferase family 4 protein [Viscerimonas tarda]
MKSRLIRITTIPISLDKLLDGQMAFMKSHYRIIAVSSDETCLKKVGEKDGVDTFCVEMTRKITPVKDLCAVWKLYRLFRREKPLFVHTHTPKAGTVGMLAARLANVPNRLHTVAGLPLLEATGKKRVLLNFVEKMTYKCATHVYPNSNGLKDIIVEEKLCPERKLKVLANGSSNGINTSCFDPSLFSPEQKQNLKNELGITGEDFTFVFVGRLVSDKGINELVEAFDNLTEENRHVKLLLVGPQESDLDPLKETTLKAMAQNKHILAVGYQSDVRPYLAISDALVFPSYREGFPNVVMQAGAMGLPSIVTDINGCNEIIVEDINGTIIPVKNALTLQRRMEDYLIDKNLLNRHKAHAREMITSRYEQRIVWQAILTEYKSLEEKHV